MEDLIKKVISSIGGIPRDRINSVEAECYLWLYERGIISISELNKNTIEDFKRYVVERLKKEYDRDSKNISYEDGRVRKEPHTGKKGSELYTKTTIELGDEIFEEKHHIEIIDQMSKRMPYFEIIMLRAYEGDEESKKIIKENYSEDGMRMLNNRSRIRNYWIEKD